MTIPYVSDGAASVNVRRAVNAAIGRANQQSQYTNIAYHGAFTADTSVAANGAVYDNAGFKASPSIPVDNNETYYLSLPGIWAAYATKDDADAGIGGSSVGGGSVAANVGFTTPSTGYWVRFHCSSTDLAASGIMMMEQPTPVLPEDFTPFRESYPPAIAPSAIRSTAVDVIDGQLSSKRNRFNPDAISSGRALANATGSGGVDYGGTDAAVYFVTDYIEVTPGWHVISNLHLSHLAFYDAQRVFIDTGPTVGLEMTANVAVTVPAGAAFMRADCTPLSSARKLMIARSASPVAWAPFGGAPPASQWTNKNVAIYGDSFTFDPDWWTNVTVALGLAVKFVDGVPGRTLINTLKAVDSGEISTSDLLLFLGGTNDFSVGLNVGALADAPSVALDASFIAQLKYQIERIITLKPDIRIAFITSPMRFDGDGVPTDDDGTGGGGPDGLGINSLGYQLVDYTDAICATCETYAIPALDMVRNSGINKVNASTILRDLLHPKYDTGYAFFSTPIIGFVRAL